MTKLAIIAGSGALPRALKSAQPDAFVAGLSGASDLPIDHHVEFEKLGALFDALRAAEVKDVVFAGGTHRPQFDPSKLDAVTTAMLPRLMPVLSQGDDAVLRAVMEEFTAQGFVMRGAHEFLDQITMPAGQHYGCAPSEDQMNDARIGFEHLALLSQLDIGQGIVIEEGLCLGVETLQGTDALLRWVGETPAHLRRDRAGVLIKAPKQGQDLRADMPVIGQATVMAAQKAGLSAIAVAAGAVMVLDQEWMQANLEGLGLSVFAVSHG